MTKKTPHIYFWEILFYVYFLSIISSPKSSLFYLPITPISMEKAMATHFSSLAWKIPWTEEPGRLQSMESLRVGHNWLTSLSISLSCIGEGNGNPLQCFCLENPRDGGAIYGVSQSWTQLKQLSSSSSQSLLEISVHFLEHCLENTSWKKVYVNVRFTCTSL